MKIKTIDVVNAYNVLKDLKLTDISEDNLMKIWKNLKILRPVAEAYTKSTEEARKSLQDDEFTKMQQRMQQCLEKERKEKKGVYELSDADRAETIKVNEYFIAWNKKGNKYFKGLSDAEVELEIQKVPEKDLLKVLQTNQKKFDDMDNISIILL